MSKQIIRVTKKGVVESISGDSQEIPSSAEFKLEGASFVQDTLLVPFFTTGTVTNESIVVSSPFSVVILPSNPTSGQKVTLMFVNGGPPGPPVGVSASHPFAPTNSLFAINVSGSGPTFSRDFTYINFPGLGEGWVTCGQGGPAGTTGSYTF